MVEYVAKFDFNPNNEDELPFRKGEIIKVKVSSNSRLGSSYASFIARNICFILVVCELSHDVRPLTLYIF